MSGDAIMHTNVHYAHSTVKAKRTPDPVHVARMADDRPEPAKRLQLARERRGFESAQAAADFFGWNYDTYIQHERGERGLTRAAKKYSPAYRVSEGWLLTGEGKGPDGEQTAVIAAPLVEPNAEFEQGAFRRPATYGPRDIEELGVTMGGDGDDEAAFEMNGQVIDRVKRPIGILDRKNVYALRVTNTSMWPRFRHGVRVYIEDRPPAIEDHVVIELKPIEDGRPGKSFIKLLTAIDARKVMVEQYNPRGILEFGRNEIKKIWRVIPDEELRGDA